MHTGASHKRSQRRDQQHRQLHTGPNNGAGAAGADVINMPSTADTLRLTATLPTITSTITINGNGWTISGDGDNDGDGDTGIFNVNAGKLSISNIT